MPAPFGDPEGVIKGGSKLQMKARKYAPLPYWRLISRQGPQTWRQGKKLAAEEQQYQALKPAQKAALLVQMKKSAWWRKQHAKRIAAMQQQGEQRSAAVRGPSAEEQTHESSALRGRGMQSLAEQQGVSKGAQKASAQQLAVAAPRQHKGMAESLGTVIAVGACSVLGVAC